MLTQEHLKSSLHYDPETGIFVWLVSKAKRVKVGAEAGCVWANKTGKKYRVIKINGKQYRAHRLAFLWMIGRFPSDEVDHINGNGLNNIWNNLREVNRQENNRNARLPSTNTSGVVGVHWNKADKKWYAQIKIDGKQKHLGSFVDKNKAISARQAANILYGFHVNHGSTRPL